MHVLYCILILNAYQSVFGKHYCCSSTAGMYSIFGMPRYKYQNNWSGNWTYSTNWGQEIFINPVLWCKDYKAVLKITIIEDSLYNTTNYICIVREDQLAITSSLTTVLNRKKGIRNEPVDQQKQSANWGSTVWKSLK